jgi:hypothetical protein
VAIQIPGESISFASNEAQAALAMRTNILAMRRLVDAVDLIELEMLIRVLTQVNGRVDIDINTIWLAVLRRHHHAEIAKALIDTAGDYQHETYNIYRQQALTVYRRLEVTAAGKGVVEDKLVTYPDGDQQEASNDRRLAALLSWAAEQLNAIYAHDGSCLDGRDLLGQLEFDARYPIEHHFAQQWFDDPFALGYNLMAPPTSASSAFGGHRAQIALIRALSEIVNEAVDIFEDTSRTDEERAPYGHRVVLFWQLLKGVAYSVAESLNSPIRDCDNSLIELLNRALTRGRKACEDADPLDVVTHGWSESGTEIRLTPTSDLVEMLNTRLAAEQAERVQFLALMR